MPDPFRESSPQAVFPIDPVSCPSDTGVIIMNLCHAILILLALTVTLPAQSSRTIATVPEQPSNRFGRPLFQGLQYSDTPTVPLAKMEYTLKDTGTLSKRGFKVMTVNTAGLRSK